jgi:hypothetical protein
MVVLQGGAELFQMILTFRSACRFPCRLHSRQQERDKNANDGNDDEQLNKRKTSLVSSSFVITHGKPPPFDMRGAVEIEGRTHRLPSAK